MYELGDIVSLEGIFYITFMYKGKYYCVNTARVGDVSEVATHWMGYKKLSELQEAAKDERDARAMVVVAEEHGTEPAQVGDIYNRMMLFKKKKGRLVWVPLEALRFNDLNDLLHRKNYYYKNGEERVMFKYEITEVAN
ncbi:hypothetical protein [Lactobacillus phage Bassarid]|nr:hypothetical protein [Lactobacillus phage Bassarid]